MLVPAPYQAPEKKAKGTKGGLHYKGTSGVVSEDAKTHSPPVTDDEKEEESNSPPEGGRQKRAAPTHLVAEASKRGKASLADNSAWDIDTSSEWRPRVKPLPEL